MGSAASSPWAAQEYQKRLLLNRNAPVDFTPVAPGKATVHIGKTPCTEQMVRPISAYKQGVAGRPSAVHHPAPPAREHEDPSAVQDIATLFEAFDSEGLGTLDCDVLSHVLTSVASDLVGDEEAICALLHRASCRGDGRLSRDDLRAAVLAAPSTELPHLVLHFDVNQTIVVLDSAAGLAEADVLSFVLANTSWGTVRDARGSTLEDGAHGVTDGCSWRLASNSPSVEAPSLSGVAPRSLCTYTEFVVRARTPAVHPLGRTHRPRDSYLRLPLLS
jgi:hypothetical protein